ncbi:MAG TPA: hypothetical protein VFQ92_08900, partial [Blastocatellia bacterium]|nr:hypothetical protein [Blastocatellia bacterium]
MIRAIVSVLVPFIIGFAFIRLLWRGAAASRAELGMQIALAAGAGFGIFSSLFFIWLLLFNTRRGFQTIAILIATGLTAFWLFRLRARLRLAQEKRASGAGRPTKIDRIFSAGFFLSLLSAIGTFIFAELKRPHGEWDAWASWNMRARFIYRGDNQWSTVFSKTLWYSGADYPLLLPASVAGCWTVAGSDTQTVPALIALLFTFATVGVVASSIAAIKG